MGSAPTWEYLRILQLAALHGEAAVTAALWDVMAAGRFDYVTVQTRVAPPLPTIPTIHIPAPDLRAYDALLLGATA